MSWRNERTLYRRKCDLCNKDIIAIYSSGKFKVYCRECFWSDRWNPENYAKEYDFSRSFFKQFNELQKEVPRLYAMTTQDVKSDYVNGTAFNKNCYLIIASDHNEDSAYSYSTFYCKDVFDCTGAHNCELSSWVIDCEKSFKIYNTQDSIGSQDLYFCKNCHNCHDCVGCVNLRNKSYCIFNRQYSKEEYVAELEKLNIGAYSSESNIVEKLEKISMQLPFKYIHGKNNVNVSGDYLTNSKKSFSVFDSQDMEDSKFINIGNKVKDSYDAWAIVDNVELNYENISHNSSKTKFTFAFWSGHNGFYSDTCEGGNNLFASIGLRNKSYCILNRQYTKEEYEALVPRIIKHMNDMPYIDKKGRVYKYGEFFPPELSPFAYNETIA
ncbi:hypothetical protein HYW53_02640, partial [Candidatus Giovannonibacteria bacterium]|nr:hypothetical protein [Candidatus Giovannonibacteria bacterium]